MIIAIDGGTTNTRFTLVQKDVCLDKMKVSLGARDGKKTLTAAVRDGIRDLLCRNSFTEKDIRLVAFSGMIGSEKGLFCAHHTLCPAGLAELKQSTSVRQMPELCNIPVAFLPGAKTLGDLDETDIMRGEETELMGILAAKKLPLPLLAVLPGSHMKLVYINEKRQIVRFTTSLCGELCRAAAEHTILKDSLQGVFPETLDKSDLLAGYNCARRYGTNQALFKVRIQDKFFSKTPEQLYAFLLGAVLYGDVVQIKKENCPVLLAGSEPFRGALYTLLEGRATLLDDDTAENAAARGAYEITKGV